MLNEMLSKVEDKIKALNLVREHLARDEQSLREAHEAAQRQLSEQDAVIASAMKERESLQNMIKVVPEKQVDDSETESQRQKRLAVFTQMRQIPNAWIKPFGIAALTGLEAEEVCAILRRASKIDGIPLEHNGERGAGSMYRWVGEPLK